MLYPKMKMAPLNELPVEIWTPEVSDINRKFYFCQILCGFSNSSYKIFIWTEKPKSHKNEIEKCKMNESEPLSVRILLGVFRLFTEIFRFLLRRSLVFVLWMRALLVIKLNIVLYPVSEFSFWTVFCAVKLFALHISKEALRYGIIVCG